MSTMMSADRLTVRSVYCALLVVASLGAGSCGSNDSGPSTKPLASLVILPAHDTIIVKGDTALTASGFDVDHNSVPTGPVSWSSLDTATATVSASGLLSSLTLGSARIVAVAGGHADTAQVTVVPRVTVSADWTTLLVGDSIHGQAALTDAHGTALAGPVVTWASGDSSKLHALTGGAAVGLAGGPATLIASAAGGHGALPVTVIAKMPFTHSQVMFLTADARLLLENRDGSGRTPLLDSLDQVQAATWSRDGSQLGVWYDAPALGGGLANAGVNLVANGTGVPQSVAPHGELASVAPDGSLVAFIEQVGSSNYDIFVAGAGGVGRRDVTGGPGVETSPAWSPDAQLIAYRVGTTGQLWVAPSDSGAQRQLPFPFYAEQYAWSPDGRYLVIRADSNTASGLYGSWLIRRDGTGVVALSPGCSVHSGCGAQSGVSSLPSWSPDARRLVFFSREAGGPEVIEVNTAGAVIRTIPWGSSCGADPGGRRTARPGS